MRVNAEDLPGKWCLAKPGADNVTLNYIISLLCSNVDCTIISEGNACYTPDQLLNHASVVMNLYYQDQGRQYWSCVNVANNVPGVISNTDPSYGNCTYEFKQ
ncbi:Glucan endo-1,3-beta-glucosidase [Cardamine amara subsp. amara]|uniref:Glucan endo-1,3-beta-glucosidase n=1 Tax=Cardamine amara subsp. amara TaxID=228776 RepID=A0ABD0Z950_CARAN